MDEDEDGAITTMPLYCLKQFLIKFVVDQGEEPYLLEGPKGGLFEEV
jgi:hypothetical protein